MPIKFHLTLAAFGLSQLAACTQPSAHDPLRVMGETNAFYDTDLATCRSTSGQYDGDLVAKGASVGALIGAVAGATEADDNVEGALVGAALGAGLGALEGEVDKQESRREMTLRCMQNKGHQVIG